MILPFDPLELVHIVRHYDLDVREGVVEHPVLESHVSSIAELSDPVQDQVKRRPGMSLVNLHYLHALKLASRLPEPEDAALAVWLRGYQLLKIWKARVHVVNRLVNEPQEFHI